MDANNSFMSYLSSHPYIGLTLSVLQAAGGTALSHVPETKIPEIYMQLFQIGAWIGAMAVAAVTVVGFIMKVTKDIKESRKSKKN